MKKLTFDEENVIIRMYLEGFSMRAVGDEFGYNSATIFNVLKRNGVKSRTKGGIDLLPEDSIISMYTEGNSCQYIADKFGVTFHTISNILDKYGIARDNNYYNLSLNHNYFDVIDSFDKAYFLGFLMTDGNVSGNAVRLELQARDVAILETFNRYCGNSNSVKSYRDNSVSISLKSKLWVNSLAKYGVVENKRYITYLPDIDDSMMPHFIRGVFDGNGTISSKRCWVGLCGSSPLVYQLRDYILDKLELKPTKLYRSNSCLYNFKWAARKDVLKFCEYLYRDKCDCYLERKYLNYQELLKLYGNTEITN